MGNADLGIALANEGKLDEAVRAFQDALRQNPSDANLINNIGVALAMQGKPAEAAVYFRQAVSARPGNANYHTNLGNALTDTGRPEDALASYRQSLHLNPNSESTHYGLGNAYRSLGRLPEAVHHYRSCLQLVPDYPKALHGLGTTLVEQGRHDEAISCFQRALLVKPDFWEARHGLGMAFAEQGDFDAAIACYRQVLSARPDMAEAHNNLGNALLQQEKAEEAVAAYSDALRLQPDFPQAHKNLANALYSQGKLEEATAQYDQALQQKPDFGEAHWNRSLVRLLVGDFEQGWPEYEWRWTQPGFQKRSYAQPLWDGSALEGRTLFVYAEQGLGDTIQFIRYAALAKQRGGKVIFECQLPLMRLLANVQGIDRLLAPGHPPPSFDVQAALLSLPGIFRTRLETIPAAVPYLHADGELVEHWRRELEPLQGYFKVGIVWQGSQQNRRDTQRSIPLKQIAALAGMKGVKLISLQKGPGAEQLRASEPGLGILDLGSRLDEAAGPFMDSAALIMNLDLVISADTAIAHLAAALGAKVWVPLCMVPDWRWLLGREDSPWYPSMRLFRQMRDRDWQGVFECIASELTTRL